MITPRKPRPCPQCGYNVADSPWQDDGVRCSECGTFSEWREFAHMPPSRARGLLLLWGSGTYVAMCLLYFLLVRLSYALPSAGELFIVFAVVLFGPLISWWFIGPPVLADWAAQQVAPPHRAGTYLLMLIGWAINLCSGVLLVVAFVML